LQQVRLTRKRILSGMRPTGKLHLGNLHGALSNWIALQNHGDYDCFYFVADWHALTSDYAGTGEIRANTIDMVIDWLSAGLDPVKSTFFIQSTIKEHAELFLLLSMITPLAWLERNPTYKEMKEELIQKELSTFGFLGYPVLQAADIIMYKAYGVPVGVDQLPHVELTREIARRFNFLYADIFPIPEPLLAEVPKLLGIDGRKMSKYYDNAIFMSDRGDERCSQIPSGSARAIRAVRSSAMFTRFTGSIQRREPLRRSPLPAGARPSAASNASGAWPLRSRRGWERFISGGTTS
jgi:tryptophanyl-tRNA synthetase